MGHAGRMTLSRLGKGLRRGLRRPAGRLLSALLILAVLTTGFPRLEAHAHAHGEASHAPMVHQGYATAHDHHAGHDHDSGEWQHAKGDGSAASERAQHVHLLPHVVALPPSLNLLPVLRAAQRPVAVREIIRPSIRPEELFRPPIC